MRDALARLIHIASFHASLPSACDPAACRFLPLLWRRHQGRGKTEVLPMQKAAPAAIFIETAGTETDLRRQLRAKNAVAELGDTTPKVLFSQAPTGAYGFIPPKLLGLALVTQSPDLGMERIASAANAYEIHKLADGSGMLVGFVALGPYASSDAEPTA